MSTYVTRFVEVKVSDIKGKVLNITELDNIHDEGSIYYVVSGKEWGYYKCIDGKWVRTNDVPQKWVLAQNVVSTKYRHYKKNTEETEIQDGWCDCGGAIRDVYLSSAFGVHNLTDRGFPKDMSQELKDKFADGSELQYTWGHTYVTLGEWQDVIEKETEKWKTDILNLFSKKREDKINDKP